MKEAGIKQVISDLMEKYAVAQITKLFIKLKVNGMIQQHYIM
jgi:hypothetical protein